MPMVWRRSYLAPHPAPHQTTPHPGAKQVRDGAKRIVRVKEGEAKGRHVVIVDDLVQSGGTLIECHAVLAGLGAKHGECQALVGRPGRE